jgi:hypothetical protein
MNKAGAKISNKNIVNVIISNDKLKKKYPRRKRANAIDLTGDTKFSNYDNLQTEILRNNLMNAEQRTPIINRENLNEVHFIRNGNPTEDINVQSQWDDINKSPNKDFTPDSLKSSTNLNLSNDISKSPKKDFTPGSLKHNPNLYDFHTGFYDFSNDYIRNDISNDSIRNDDISKSKVEGEIQVEEGKQPDIYNTPTNKKKKIRVKLNRGRPVKGIKYEIPNQDVLDEQARQKQRDNYQAKVSAVKYANDMNEKILRKEIIPSTQEERKVENNNATFGLNNNIRTFSNK